MMLNKPRKYLPNTRKSVKSIITLTDNPWRWSVGIYAGIAVALPLSIFTIAGYQSLGLIAALGAFTALYGAGLRRIDRLRVLPFIIIGLSVASILGVLSASNIWLTSACLIVVSAVACTFTIGIGLGAPGPLMFVLVAAVSAHLAAPVGIGGAGIDKGIIPMLVTLGGFLSYLVVIAPLVIPSVRKRDGSPSAFKEIFPNLSFDKISAAISIRIIIATSISTLAANYLGVHRSYWVVLAAIAVLQSGHNRRLTTIRAVHRVLGTIIGIFLFAVILLIDPVGLWLVGLIAFLQFATEVVVTRNYGLALIFITPLALVNSASGHTSDTMLMIQSRVIDSLLGAAIGMAVFWTAELLRKPETIEVDK